VWRGSDYPDPAKQEQLAVSELGERALGTVAQMLFIQERRRARLFGKIALPWTRFAIVDEIPPEMAETK